MNKEEIVAKISEKGLRVTPQRVAIMQAVIDLDNHPIVENILESIKKNYPSISVGTVYKVLESFVEHDLLRKVKTELGTMRFDPLLDHHHHLYCTNSEHIEDYKDEELDNMLKEYFKKNNINNFEIENIQLHITGNFKTK